MKVLLPLILLALLVPIQSQTAAQAPQRPAIDREFVGKKLNWLEKRYRNMGVDRVVAAEKKLADAQDKLDKTIAALEYPDQQKEIFSQKVDIAIYQKEFDAARDELTKVDELLAKALANTGTRKLFNRELKAAVEKEYRQTAAENSSYRSPYPYWPSTFTVSCYSGGFGRYFWVRCTSHRY